MKLNNSKEFVEKRISFIRNTVTTAGFSDIVIAVSGGVDSAVGCALSVQALGKEHVYPLFLPYGELNRQGVIDGQLVTSAFSIPFDHIQEINIKPMVDAMISYDSDMTDLRQGNIMARTRMIILFDQAKKRKALVMGTENKTEHLLGYFTRFGDEASDIEPIIDLYKTQVYEVAQLLGIPEALLKKSPTAGLWEGQTDEGEFGFSYEEADTILSLIYDQGYSLKELEKIEIKKESIERILKKVQDNTYKQSLPYAP